MYDTQWKCDIMCYEMCFKIILLMKEHIKKQSIWISVSCYGSNLFWDCRCVAVVSLLTPGQHE